MTGRTLSHWSQEFLNDPHPEAQQFHLNQLPDLLHSDAALVTVIAPNQPPLAFHLPGMDPQAHQFFAEHAADDPYIQAYIDNNLWGQSLHLQPLVTNKSPTQSEFFQAGQSHFDFDYSFGMLLPLAEGIILGVSCHRSRRPFGKTDIATKIQALTYSLLPYALSCRLPHPNQIAKLSSEPLTPSELQIIKLLGQGMNGSEIASSRRVSKETIKSQLKTLLHKTRCRHQNHLMAKLAKLNLIS